MRVFIAVFAATVILGPLLAVGFFLVGQFLVFDVADRLLSSIVRLVLDAPAPARTSSSIAALSAQNLRIMIQLAYAVGAQPVILGGAFLGWRFSRTPPRSGVGAPLLLGLALGVAIAFVFVGFGGGNLAARATFAALAIGVSGATAIACWAIGRLLHRLLAPHVA